jgi:hypothetical protein
MMRGIRPGATAMHPDERASGPKRCEMKTSLFLIGVAGIAAVVWFSWPAPPPLQTCEDALNTSILGCDMTKGYVK